MAQLVCENLKLGYDSTVVLQNLNFHVDSGDYLCIVWDNGAGKSTLMKAILGLLKPMDGTITWSEEVRGNKIGYLTQQSEIQREFPASVKEVVMSGFQMACGFRPFYSKKEKAIAIANMEKMRVENLANKCYRELSGGQQQRVLLARALCATKEILFLDEPVTGLDPSVCAEMYAEIENLNKNSQITILMISHDVEKALEYASHILEIGTKPFFGTTQEYINQRRKNHA